MIWTQRGRSTIRDRGNCTLTSVSDPGFWGFVKSEYPAARRLAARNGLYEGAPVSRIVCPLRLLCFGIATLALAPASAAPTGALPPHVTAFQGTAATAGADAMDGDQRGAAVALSGDVLLVGVPLDNLSRADRAGSVLVYRRGPQGWALETKLLPPQPRKWGGFGSAVALDGATAVIGATSQFSNDSGAFVFVRDGTGWHLQATLVPLPSPDASVTRFGAAVAISGSRVLVGAPGTTFGSTTPSGAAFVFARSSNTWSQQAMLRASPEAPEQTAFFGGAVTLSGADAIVGVRSPFGAGRGEAFAFHDAGGGNWGAAQRLVPDAALPGGVGFGTSVALADGLALVSAPSLQTQFVFRRVAGNWQQQSTITAPGNVTAFAPPRAYFGSEGGVVAFGIDPDGASSTALGPIVTPPRAYGFGAALAADGPRVVIGAPEAALGDGIRRPGAASVHLATDGAFALEQNLEQAVGPNEAFGRAVAIDGDNALVGAAGAGPQGVVRWLERHGGAWRQAGELRVPNDRAFRVFGTSLALRGTRVLVGGIGIDSTGTGINREAWLFRRDGAGWSLDASFAVPDGYPQHDDAATAIALAGAHAVIGAPRTSHDGIAWQGAAHAFTETPGGWVRQQILAPPTNLPGQAFGVAVALDGDLLLVGAPSQSIAAPGEVHAYRRTEVGWVPMQILVGDSPASRFGTAITLDAENAWIGAPGGASRKVFRFPRMPDGTLGVPQRFDPPPGAEGFGDAIASGGDRVLVGAAIEGFWPAAPTIPGAVYRIERVGGTWAVSGKINAADYSSLAQFFGLAIAADAGAFIIGAPRSGSEMPFGNPFEGAAFVVDDQILFGDGFEP